MKKQVALLTVLAAAALCAQAQVQVQPQPLNPSPTFVDRARVQSVEPQYESVQIPRNECTSQWVTESRPATTGGSGVGGTVIGAVAGGVLGNQVGKGHGREAATAAGAVLGALAGNRIATNMDAAPPPEQTQREVRTCRTVNDVQNRLVGYRVNYEYHGNRYTTVTREQPGNTLPVRVSVTPVEEREYHGRQ